MTLAVMAVPALSLVTLPGPTSAVTDDVLFPRCRTLECP